MKAKNRSTSDYCDLGTLQRVRYFPRQLITPDEMTLDQKYARDMQRRHNRLLHGWGVVCGAEVCAARNADGSGWEPWKVRVRPGFALAPSGDEIAITKERVLDLRVSSMVGGPEDVGGDLADPWCRPVYQDRLPEVVYLAVRYHEIMTRQVRVQPAGCGCDDAGCEFSRICDGYEVGVLPNCPPSHTDPPKVDLAALINRPLEMCPECPEDDWVVLARIQVNQAGRILAIDNCSCRRVVVSFAGTWGKCTSAGPAIDDVSVREMEQGGKYDVVVKGSNLQQGAAVDMGSWVKVSQVTFTVPTKIKFHVEVKADAPPGEYALMIANPDCSLAVAMVQVKAKP